MRLGNDVESGDSNVSTPKLLERRDRFVVSNPYRRIGTRLHCKLTDWPGHYFQMIDEASVVPRHVGLHAFEEWGRVRAFCRPVWSGTSESGRGGGGGMVNAEEDIQCVDQRALPRAGPGELPRLSEIYIVSTFVLKDPQPLAAVLSSEPGAYLVVKYGGIAAVAYRVEDGGQVADHG